MWDLIVSVPDHYLSFYFGSDLSSFLCIGVRFESFHTRGK